MAMFNIKTLLSTFDRKGTLMKWLKELTEMLQKSALTGVSVEQTSQTKAVLKFNFEDGSVITSDALDLPRGLPGPAGPQGPKGDAGGADFADVSAFDIITPAAGTVEVSADGLTYTGQVNLTSAGVTYNIPAEVTIPLTGGNGISLDADETGHKIVIKLDSGGLPSSLPQTYKKKAVTLATSGWVVNDITDLASTSNTFTKNVSKRIGNTPYYSLIDATSKIYITDTHYNLINEEMTFKHWNGAAYVWLVNKNGYETINIEIYTVSGSEISKGDVNIKYLRNDTPISSFVDVKGKIVGVTTDYNYVLTDADVKVNSEVHFTLDKTNGKLAGQFGLKKTIDKEAGKLTFTADTLPTSAISGTLEIGETSTEGAAFVEGISEDVESSATAVYFPSFVSSGSLVQPGIARGTAIFDAGEQQKEIDVTNYVPGAMGAAVAMARSVDTSFLPSVCGKLYSEGGTNKSILKLVLSSPVPELNTIYVDFILFFIKDV